MPNKLEAVEREILQLLASRDDEFVDDLGKSAYATRGSFFGVCSPCCNMKLCNK